jgi:hypothetical protein
VHQLSYTLQPMGHPMTAIKLSQKHDEWGILYKHNLIFGWLIEMFVSCKTMLPAITRFLDHS